MYSIIISVGIGLLVGAIIAASFSPIAAIIPAIFATVLSFVLLMRYFFNRLQAIFLASNKHIEAQKLDLAIKTLEDGYKYNKWMILAESQLKSQVGCIQYIRKDFDKAFPNLQVSIVRNWVAQGMLASVYYRRKDYDKMEAVLEKAAKTNAKVPLMWGLYGWLEDAIDKPEKALEVFRRGVEANPDDEALKSNLLNLQNKKKLKMTKFGEAWYQFLLEPPPMRLLQPPNPRFSAFRRR